MVKKSIKERIVRLKKIEGSQLVTIIAPNGKKFTVNVTEGLRNKNLTAYLWCGTIAIDKNCIKTYENAEYPEYTLKHEIF